MTIRKLLAIAFGLCIFVQPTFVSAASLSKNDAGYLALARAQGITVADIHIIVSPGKNGIVLQDIETGGGRVVNRADEVSFLSAVIPISLIDELKNHKYIEEFDLDFPAIFKLNYKSKTEQSIPLAVGATLATQAPTNPTDENWRPKLKPFPFDHPHSVHDDLNAAAWMKQNPTYDGRGVVIGFLEGLADPLAPELQIAYDLQGRQIRKIQDFLPAKNTKYGIIPKDDIDAWNWVRLKTPKKRMNFPVTNGAEKAGAKNTLYLAGVLNIPNVYLDHLKLEHFNPDKTVEIFSYTDGKIDATPFNFLWRESDLSLLLDSDLDLDFTDETPIHPFDNAGGIIILGTDDPNTLARETMGLIYKWVPDNSALAFEMGFGTHVAVTTGAAVASKGENGKIDGVAPGASIIPISHGPSGGSLGNFANSMIKVFSDPRIDLVLLEGQFPKTDYRLISDGRNMYARLLSRLVDYYQKPAFATGGNMPGVNRGMHFCMGANVNCVGAYQSRQTTLVNQGLEMGAEDSLHWVGVEGPSSNGGLKPDFLAPANPLTLSPRFGRGLANSNGISGLYEPIPGYSIGGGTSTAAPVAAGAAALLISAAKQNNLPHDVKAINLAIRSSTRYLGDNIKTYQQGRGLIDVAAAWDALKRQSAETKIVVDIMAPVQTVSSHFLEVPHKGIGLFEREGWIAGDVDKRTIVLERKNGQKKSIWYEIEWRGNDDKTFSSSSRIKLPLDKPVKLKVKIAPQQAGIHSALLVLKSLNREDTILEVGMTVVAAEEFTEKNNFHIEKTLDMPRPGRRSVFIKVPEGADALNISGAFQKPGMSIRVLSPTSVTENILTQTKDNITIMKPVQGVWEIFAHDISDAAAFDWAAVGQPASHHKIGLKISLLGADIVVKDTIVHVRNKYAEATGRLSSTSLASVRELQRDIKAGEQHVYDLRLEAGTNIFMSTVEGLKKPNKDIDLYLYFCPEETKCIQMRRSKSVGSKEQVFVEDPQPGHWKIIVDAASLRAGSVKYNFSDLFSHPKFGTLNSADIRSVRKPGEEWEVPVNIWKREQPTKGRKLRSLYYLEYDDAQSFHTAFVPTETASYHYQSSDQDWDVVPIGLKIHP